MRSHLAWPLVLIVLGIVLLLSDLGFLPPIAWRSFAFLWPIVLVVLGIGLLTTGRISWAGVLGSIVVLFTLALVAGALGFGGAFIDRGRPTAGSPTGERRVEASANGVRAADVEIDYGAGRLDVATGAREGLLADAMASGSGSDRLDRTLDVRDGVGRVRIFLQGGGFRGLLPNRDDVPRLTVRLSRSIQLNTLQLSGGASELNVDLGDMQVQRVSLHAGASSGRVRLPGRGQVTAELNAG